LSSADDTQAPPVVADCIDEVLEEAGLTSSIREAYRDYIETIIRKVFYQGTPRQREYLANLSRTYVLLFTLQADPHIVEYFSTMSASFHLYLGTDILVKALSERYLAPEDQVARNLLKIAHTAGVKMYLSQCVLEEVYTHVRATNYEFINYFEQIESFITREIVRNSDKILIRSYFYAKEERLVSGWKSYLNQFITYDNILQLKGKEELRKYLISTFKLSFTENALLESVTDETKVRVLAKSLLDNDDKKNEALAYNTALLVYGIYGLRSKFSETSGSSEHGLKTWWMTNQTRVLRHTGDLVREKQAQYVMRPEFLLNFIALAPTCDDVRKNFDNIFPSIFGIQLGHRLKEDVFHKIMASVREWKDYEPGRISALMSGLSDKLKADRLKRYERTLNDGLP
jgi:hypothetical protein